MGKFDRSIINEQTRFVDDMKDTGRVILNHNSIINSINFYNSWLEENVSDRNKLTVIPSLLSSERTCLVFALSESGFNLLFARLNPRDLDELDYRIFCFEYEYERIANMFEGEDAEIVVIPQPDLAVTYPENRKFLSGECLMSSFTSGTTGKPKNVTHIADAFAHALDYHGDRYRPGLKKLVACDLFHMAYLSISFLPAINAGCDVHFINCFGNDVAYHRYIKEEQINLVLIFPSDWWNIRNKLDFKLDHHVVALTGGDIITQNYVEQLQDYGIDIVEVGYGSSEVLAPVTDMLLNRGTETEDGMIEVGKVRPYIDCKTEEDGRLTFTSSVVCYKFNGEETNGTLTVDDQGEVRDGVLYLKGREGFIKNQNHETVLMTTIRGSIPSRKSEEEYGIKGAYEFFARSGSLYAFGTKDFEHEISKVYDFILNEYKLSVVKFILLDSIPSSGIKTNKGLLKLILDEFKNKEGFVEYVPDPFKYKKQIR